MTLAPIMNQKLFGVVGSKLARYTPVTTGTGSGRMATSLSLVTASSALDPWYADQCVARIAYRLMMLTRKTESRHHKDMGTANTPQATMSQK